MKKFFEKIRNRIFHRKNSYLIDDEEYIGEGEEAITGSEEILAKVENIRRGYYFWLYFIVLIIFVILFVRLWVLQVIQGDYNKTLAEGNRIRTRSIVSTRGIIYDRNKVVLAKNIPDFALVAYPADLSRTLSEREDFYRKIANFSAIPFEEIRNKMEASKDRILESIVLKENLTHEESLILEERTSGIKGISVEKRSTRGYVAGIALGHILGYVGDINEEEYKANPSYNLDDNIGKSGIEKSYEEKLKGVDGKEQVEVDSSGRLKRILAKRDPVAGDGLVLSIDSDLQAKTREYLSAQLKSQNSTKGVAIVSDPRNGEILAIISLPDYDNNIFSSPNLSEVYPQLANNPNQPLFNRAISGVYPSGSTIKPVVAAAALQEGVIGVNDWINDDKGELDVPNQYDPSIIYRYPAEKACGWINITKAIAESCNVFFYTIGGGFDKIKGLGVGLLGKYFNLFGLGAKTGIDLDGEARGLVPTAEWKQKAKGEPWVLGDTYHLSIGQGDLGVTPLQINNYTNAIANGGILYKPRLAKALISSINGTTKDLPSEIIRKDFADSSVLSIVRQGMRMCVTSGSCDKLVGLPVTSAGKTGTAETSNLKEPTHAWFTAYAPYDNPQISVTVLVENGGSGYASAEPVAQNILQYYFTRLH
jgi:penicillin-binding protein 2